MLAFVFFVIVAVQWSIIFPDQAHANKPGVVLALVHIFAWALLGEVAAGASGSYTLAVLFPVLGPLVVSGVSYMESGDASS